MRKAILSAWFRTRVAMLSGADALEGQRRRLEGAVRDAMRDTPAYRRWADAPLSSIPIIDAADARNDFQARNRLGLSSASAANAADVAERGGAGEVRPGVIAGFSTGSSGKRGVFLASAAERADYIGQSLARLLPASALIRGSRIALILRANSGLYRDVQRAGRFDFGFFPLGRSAGDYSAELGAFRPDTLVAPAHVLADLARAGVRLPTLRRLFWGAEPMGEAERRWIGERLGVRPDPIWQATEGFLGAACKHGNLHLNEGSIAFDCSPVDGATAFQPVVTDLRRFTQPVVRIRLDDVMEFEPKPCSCRFGGRVIKPVSGRVGDIWRLPGRTLLPREVTDMFEATLGPAAEWVAIASRSSVTVRLRDAALRPRAEEALQKLGVDMPSAIEIRRVLMDGPKRRRARWSVA